MAKTAKAKRDIQQEITDRIIAQIEQGVSPWRQEWKGTAAQHNPASGTIYRGINWLTTNSAGFTDTRWLTMVQVRKLGGKVIKGSKSTPIVYWNVFEKTETSKKTGEEATKSIPYLKHTNLFNAEQIEGCEIPTLDRNTDLVCEPAERNQAIDAVIAATGATIHHGGPRAYYRPSTDEVTVPNIEDFTTSDHYYATVLHELAHWTGHESRLDRTKIKRYGDPDYAFEELIAELSAAMLTAQLGIDSTESSHAAYIDSWLKCLKADKGAIIKAASFAQKAVDHIMPQADDTAEDIAA